MVRLTLITLLGLMLAGKVSAQQEQPWEELLMSIAEDDDHENEVMLNLYEELSELASSPININNATEQDLARLPFLTEQQRMDISEYLDRYGKMQTLAELAMIASLSAREAALLRHFVYAGEKTVKDTMSLMTIVRRGKQEVTATAGIPLYERKGDRNGYMGYKYKHWVRYDFNSHNRLRFGVVGAQDAGEPLFSGGNGMGYDHYSIYMQRRQWGAIDNVVAGHYRINTGMGLVINNGMSFGKSAMIAGLARMEGNAIKVHSSRSASNYLQGAAATVKAGKGLAVTAWGSYRGIDATLNEDGSAATIIATGYHRTPTEMGKKNNTYVTDAGANIKYRFRKMHIGATVAYTHLDRTLRPNTNSIYRRFYPEGNSFLNGSVDYSIRIRNMRIFGETAADKYGNLATINAVNINIRGLALTALHRYYSREYQSLRANSFCDGGRVQNENGLYVGVNWKVTGKLSVMAYSDFAYFEWPKYMATAASVSADNVVSANYLHNNWTFGMKYRARVRQRDNEEKTMLKNKTEHRASLWATHNSGRGWNSTTRADVSLASFEGCSRGFMVGQTVNYNGEWIRIGGAVRYFNTDNYDSRLYAYEGGLYHTLGSALCYGHGIRWSLTARVWVYRQLSICGRLSTVNRFDVGTTGSGLQTVDGSSLTDVALQLNWKL